MISGSPFRWTEPSTWPWIVYVWLALILVGWLKPLWRWIQRQRCSSWPTVSGQIEYASVSEAKSSFFTSRRGNSPSHVGELGYSYFVAGNTYSGQYRREFWSEEEALEFVRDLKGKALAVQYMVYGFFGYAFLNFALFMAKAPSGHTEGTPPIVWRGFSGHWMAFYSAALATLYSAAKASGDVRRCLNGHVMPATASFCSRCGQSLTHG